MTEKSTERPEVSVVMPVYNSERFLREALDSVLAQTFTGFELIAVDDCSTDDTAGILGEYAEKDERFRVITLPENGGVAEARNVGVAAARGEYISFIDSDDVWRTDKTEKELNKIKESGVDIVYCSYRLTDENGEKCGGDFIVPEKTCFEDMLVKSVINTSTALGKKTLFEKFKFDGSCYHEDYLLWMQILSSGGTAVGLTEPLADYRQRKGSRSGGKIKSARERYRIYKERLGLPFTKRISAFIGYAVNGIKKYG